MIDTPSGSLRPQYREDGVTAALGIPYARARLGEPPEPVTSWEGVLDATDHGPICPQIPGLLEQGMGLDRPMDHDCTNLAVFVPPGVSAADRVPVIVWIHGGAFETGAASAPWYDGGEFARRHGAIVVGINYRLGLFGFWRDRNLGLLDQIAALRWVHSSISAFGGDPNRITLLGESAGGCSVLALLASPETSGLIAGAWAMSPSTGQMRTRVRAEEIAGEVLALAGVASEHDLFARGVEGVLDAQRRLGEQPNRRFDEMAPTVGGAALPDDVLDALAHSPAPLVIGTTKDEHRLWTAFDPTHAAMDREFALLALQGLVGPQAPYDPHEVWSRYESARPGSTPSQIVAAATTDEVFRRRAQVVAESRAEAGTATWMYWFSWESPAFGGALGSCHGLDIPFAFAHLDAPGVTMFTGEPPSREALAVAYSTAVATLAHTGAVDWEPFTLSGRATWRFDDHCELLHDPEPDLRAIWEDRDVIRNLDTVVRR